MKVYAIKNKKGKYFDDFQDFETNNICDARLFDTYEEALSFCPKNCDCEVVEITIAEGDLEQQLAIIKRALLKASKEAFGDKISVVNSNYSKKITNSKEYAEYLIFETESEVKNGN